MSNLNHNIAHTTAFLYAGALTPDQETDKFDDWGGHNGFVQTCTEYAEAIETWLGQPERDDDNHPGVLAYEVIEPLGAWLIDPASNHPDTGPAAGLSYEAENAATITPVDLMRTLFVLHLVIIIGLALHDLILMTGLRLPSFVPCMLVAIVTGNLLPVLLPRLPPVPRSPALSLMTDFALGSFLAMSLMAMQLWTLAGMGLLVAVSLALQTMLALAFVFLLLFRIMGRDYFAAVLAAGYAGFAVGATPTAIANMNAVTKRHGPSPLAFVILPLITAFFVDLANAAVIQLFLAF